MYGNLGAPEGGQLVLFFNMKQRTLAVLLRDDDNGLGGRKLLLGYQVHDTLVYFFPWRTCQSMSEADMNLLFIEDSFGLDTAL